MHRTALLAFVLVVLCGAPATSSAQDVSNAAPPAAVLVLQPPNDTAVCNRGAFHALTYHYPSCASAAFWYSDPDEDCCQGWAEYFGPNSTRPTRNCFCDAAVAAEFMSYYEKHYYDFISMLLICARKGYPVGFNSDMETGYCYGVPPDQDTLDAARLENPDDKTIMAASYWDTAPAFFVKLHRDPLITCSFVTGVIAGVGMLMLLWPLALEAFISAGSAVSSLR